LLPALLTRYRTILSQPDRDCNPTDSSYRAITADLLEQFATEPENLAELLVDADANEFRVLLARIRSSPGDATPRLIAILNAGPAAEWDDGRGAGAGWADLQPDLASEIDRYKGFLAERFAMCQSMPIDALQRVAAGLGLSGYRPVRARPYRKGDETMVAAIWNRDGRSWRITAVQDVAAIAELTRSMKRGGLGPVDVAPYNKIDGGRDRHEALEYMILWGQAGSDGEFAELDAGVPPEGIKLKVVEREKDQLEIHTLQALHGAKGQSIYCVTWGRHLPNSRPPMVRAGAILDYERRLIPGEFQADVGLTSEIVSSEKPLARPLTRGRDLTYIGVWLDREGFDSFESHGLGVDAHLTRCREFAAEGARPAAIAVAEASSDTVVTASVWHRPTISNVARNQLVKRKSKAAIALVELSGYDHIWPLLRHSPDPSIRSQVIHDLGRLAPGVRTVKAILARLDTTDVSTRRALIIALGEFELASIPDFDLIPLDERLKHWYVDDPDPGVHSAIDWLYHRWGRGRTISDLDAQLAGKPRGHRSWFVNSKAKTFAFIPGPVRFQMGSPAKELGRIVSLEEPHLKQVSRSFAISTKEVTVAEFRRFDPKFFVNENSSPEPDCPITGVNWYDAARYCRWLSEQEGIDPNQMCYPETARIRTGMTMPADYLERVGYRLPTESEWEFVCRSQARTPRFYGSDSALLSRYAWFTSNSIDRTHPVGSLRPNDAGFFDILGNAREWTQDHARSYLYGWQGGDLVDVEFEPAVTDDKARILRGGSFANVESDLRSAQRDSTSPNVGQVTFGFRIAKTVK